MRDRQQQHRGTQPTTSPKEQAMSNDMTTITIVHAAGC